MEKYVEAELEMVTFDAEDIITTSETSSCTGVDMGGEDLDD